MRQRTIHINPSFVLSPNKQNSVYLYVSKFQVEYKKKREKRIYSKSIECGVIYSYEKNFFSAYSNKKFSLLEICKLQFIWNQRAVRDYEKLLFYFCLSFEKEKSVFEILFGVINKS